MKDESFFVSFLYCIYQQSYKIAPLPYFFFFFFLTNSQHTSVSGNLETKSTAAPLLRSATINSCNKAVIMFWVEPVPEKQEKFNAVSVTKKRFKIPLCLWFSKCGWVGSEEGIFDPSIT